ncbi:MAG TPA: hypothetical protein VMD97_04960 [Candidatus Aquilonibacter sp.]|nr:hypothetical protein [Candidatus Aquilonibacter sp.]
MLKRLLSLVLLAAVGLPTVAPALALAQDQDANLPICCRRHGKHHCAMMMQLMARMAEQSSQPQAGAVCPFYPRHEMAPVAGAHLLAIHIPQRSAVSFAAVAPAAPAETSRRISRERSRYKRGPPSFFFDLA